MVGVIIGRMENEVEKSGEKMVFVVIWLRVENGRDFGGPMRFLSYPAKTQSSQIGEKIGEKGVQKYLDKIAYISFLNFLSNWE